MMDNKNNYKEKFYKHYVSTHNASLYGDLTLDKFKKAFPVLKYYFKKLLPSNNDAAILDIGCGDGNFVYFLHELGYKNAEGVDISPEQIQRGIDAGITKIQQGDVKQFLQSKSNKYDFIIARDLLEHFTKQEIFDLCVLVNASLKKGGVFLIQVPNGQGLFHTSILYGDFTHEVAFTHSSLTQLFSNAGFNITRSFPVEPVPHSIGSAMRFVCWKMIEFFVRFFKMIVTGSRTGIFTPNVISVTQKE